LIPVAVGLPPSTLARHPGTPVDAGLILQERRRREVVIRGDYAV